MAPQPLGRVLRWLFVSAAAASAVCAPAATPDPSLPSYVPAASVSGSLTGVSGMDTVEAMMGAWNEAFSKYHPGAHIAIEMKDEGPEDRIALGANVSEVFHEDNQVYEDTYGYEPFRIRFCLGAFVLKSHVSAIGVFVNKANPLTRLSLAELDAMFSDERRRGYPSAVTAWGHVGLTGEWADRPVHPIGFYWRDDVTAYFRKLVMHDAPFGTAYRVPGSDMKRRTPKVAGDIMATLSADPGAIAFGNFSYQTDQVKAVALVDDRGVIAQPVLSDIASGRYPLQRSLYFYVNRKPGTPLDPLVKEFLTFVLSREGQALVEKDHYLPLPAADAAVERAKLE